MPSSYTARARFELQATGENLNTWGVRLNAYGLQLIDDAINGRAAITLAAAPVTLTTANGATDQARMAILDFSGIGPATVTLPGLEARYTARNASTGSVTLTTGSGTTVVLTAGEVVEIICDGVNVRQQGVNGLGWKAYADNLAWSVSSGILPGQTTNAGKFLRTNGTVPLWDLPATTDLTDLATYTATRTAQAIAFAVAL